MTKAKDKTEIRSTGIDSNASEIDEALKMADAIAKVQGNIFVKELLRSKKKDDSTIRIGSSKDEVLNNLQAAIRQGKISHADISDWVNEVEGWGKQHVYLYTLNKKLAADPIWKSEDSLFNALKGKKLDETWNQPPSLSFPEKLKLASISFLDGKFECVWHRGVTLRQRDKDKDKPNEVIDGDVYDFQAYRHTPTRSVMRFELDPGKKEAALFVQMPMGPEHEEARECSDELLDKLFDGAGLVEVDISKAIKTLDLAEMDGDGAGKSFIQAQNTKFSSGGANVEFSAGPEIRGGWPAVTAVRQVRRALKNDKFEGNSGKFIIGLKAIDGLEREVTMSLTGHGQRIYLYAQMTADEVAETLAVIRNYAAT